MYSISPYLTFLIMISLHIRLPGTRQTDYQKQRCITLPWWRERKSQHVVTLFSLARSGWKTCPQPIILVYFCAKPQEWILQSLYIDCMFVLTVFSGGTNRPDSTRRLVNLQITSCFEKTKNTSGMWECTKAKLSLALQGGNHNQNPISLRVNTFLTRGTFFSSCQEENV